MNANDELKTKLTAALGVSLDTPDTCLIEQVKDLLQLRRQVTASAALEKRILELQQVTHCTRETATAILEQQGAAA
jgi:hypothetical protein